MILTRSAANWSSSPSSAGFGSLEAECEPFVFRLAPERTRAHRLYSAAFSCTRSRCVLGVGFGPTPIPPRRRALLTLLITGASLLIALFVPGINIVFQATRLVPPPVAADAWLRMKPHYAPPQTAPHRPLPPSTALYRPLPPSTALTHRLHSPCS